MKLGFVRLRWVLALGVLVLIATIVVATNDGLRWRASVAAASLRGDIPEIPRWQLLGWLKPNSPVYLAALAEGKTVSAAIHNTRADDPAVIAEGAEHFKQICSVCHGGDGSGAAGPNLVTFVQSATEWDFFSTVKWGRNNSGMRPQPLSDAEIWSVHAFMRDKARSWAAPTQAERVAAYKVNVPTEKLVKAAEFPDDWMTYSGDLAGHRHSRLAQINKQNASKVDVAWVAQLKPATKPLSATPIVVNGLMFVTEAPDGVVALDATTGELVWRFNRSMESSRLKLCCGAFNRGVAVLGDKVYVETLDAYLVALDAATGRELWETKVAESMDGYSMTSAPLAVADTIIVGVAGAEFGIRGFVAAYDANTGKEVWRFNAIPARGEPGNDTWGGDSWKTGGASTWSIGSYDAERDVVYWTVGNPWPPLDARVREGDNLYSNSVVAIERKTGKLLWHFQFTPADSHDWDATQQLVLADVKWNGKDVPALLMASRNAFYYAIDRSTGEFLYATPFVKQTWAKNLDSKGRPERDLSKSPSPRGSLVWPWMHGGTNWWAASYDQKRHLHYVPTVDAATLYFSTEMKYKAGEMTMGGTTQLAQNIPAVMAVKAIDPDTGAVKWTSRLDKGDFHQFARITGLVSTDGGILVAGFEDRLFILDSDSGERLWSFRPGAQVNAGAVTYALNGVQYIAVISGNALFTFALPPSDRK